MSSYRVRPIGDAEDQLGRPPSPTTGIDEYEFKLTPLLNIPNPIHEAQYIDFLVKETQPVISISLIVLTYFVYMSHSVIQLLDTSRVDQFLAVSRHLRTATLIPVLIYVYCIFQRRVPSLPRHPFNVVHVGNTVIATHSICTGLIILSRALIGACDGNVVGCNPAAYYNSLPLDAFMFCAYSMIALPMLVKCHSWTVLLASNISISLLIFASLLHVNASGDTFISALLFCFSILVTLYDYERYSMRTFFGFMNLTIAVGRQNTAEVETKVIAKHSQELRYLIGNVAHDLKTPVQAMVSEIEVLDERRGKDAELAASVKMLRTSCTFMTMMINRSLDYMKTTSGIILVPRFETVSISESLAWVTDCVGSRNEVPIMIHEVPSDVCNFIITDKQWLLENLLCLTSNAVKFVSRGSIDIRVKIITREQALAGAYSDMNGVSTPGSFMIFDSTRLHLLTLENEKEGSKMLMVEVEDTGIGIEYPAMAELFRPFKQAQRHAGGTGLGLFALSKRMESIGGACGVRDRLDKKRGCLFWFCFPYKPDSSIYSLNSTSVPSFPSAATVSATPLDVSATVQEVADVRNNLQSTALTNGDSTRYPSSRDVPPTTEETVATENKISPSIREEKILAENKFVLVVDDSMLIQKATSRSLSKDGFTPKCANNGAECLEALEKHEFILILLDINMPVMDGYETISRIRKAEMEKNNGKRQLVIGISANSDNGTREEAMRLGMDAFLEKPLKATVLRDCLSSFGIYGSVPK